MDDDTDDGAARKGGKPGKVKVKQPAIQTRPPKSGVTLRKKELVDRVAEKSGVKKQDARAAIDAFLAIVSEVLPAGEEVVVPPLGKLRMMQQKDNGKAKIATLRLQIMPEGEAERPKAKAEDE